MFSHGGHLVECFVENTVITVSTVRDLDGHVQLRSPCRPLTMLTVLTQTPLSGDGRKPSGSNWAASCKVCRSVCARWALAAFVSQPCGGRHRSVQTWLPYRLRNQHIPPRTLARKDDLVHFVFGDPSQLPHLP